jgi:hypothetical protein
VVSLHLRTLAREGRMTVTIGRRELLAALRGAAAWPLAARAQQAGKLPTIGFLGADASSWSPWTAAFVERMRKLGWIEGRTIAIEYAILNSALSQIGRQRAGVNRSGPASGSGF